MFELATTTYASCRPRWTKRAPQRNAAKCRSARVVVIDDEIVARAGNRTIADCDPTAHAEVIALREASKKLGNYRLAGAELYVTIEPCAMCAGAMIQARIARLIYGAPDAKGGAVRSCFTVLDHPQLNHRVEVTAGVLAEDAAAVLKDFFAARR